MKTVLVPFVAIITVLVAGCGEKDPEALMLSAKEHLASNEKPAAIIDLKNALRAQPKNSEARLLLGNIYTSQGAFNSASKELEFALKMGQDSNQVFPNLAKAYYNQTDAVSLKKLVEDGKMQSIERLDIVYAYDGLLSLELGDKRGFRATLRNLERIAPDSDYTKLADAYYALAKGDAAQADRISDNLLTSDTVLEETYFLKGQISVAKRDFEDSVKYFQTYTELHPQDMRGSIFLANALVRAGEYDKANPLLDNLLQVSPNQPYVNFLKSLALYQTGKLELALGAAEKALQNGMNNTSVRVIAGISALGVGKKESAYGHLSSLKTRLDPSSPVLKILTGLSIELGYLDEELDSLMNQEELTESDVLMLSSASAELVKSGEVDRAKEVMSKLDDVSLQTESALVSRGIGNIKVGELSGIADLEKALEIEPESVAANTFLAKTLIDTKQYEKAIQLSKKWQEANSDDASGFALEGLALNQMGEEEQAKVVLEKALNLDNQNTIAAVYFADESYNEGEIDAAIGFLQPLTKKPNTSTFVLEKLVSLYSEKGDVESGIKVFQSKIDEAEAIKKGTLQVSLARILFQLQRYDDAVNILELVGPDAHSEKYWVTLGNSLYFSGRVQESIESTIQWVDTDSNSETAYARLVNLYERTRQLSKAMDTAREAAELFQTNRFQVLLADIASKAGDGKLARSKFNNISPDLRDEVTIQTLEAQVLLSERKPLRALNLLKEIYEIDESIKVAWLVSKAYLSLGEKSQAFNFYNEHLISSPEDRNEASEMDLAELALHAEQYKVAINIYESVIQKTPDNAKVNNNLAYLYNQNGNTELALQHSEKAIAVSPESFSYLDTRGTVLASSGDYDGAAKVYEKMFALTPNNKDVVKRMISVYIKVGNEERVTQLEKLL
jgi:putative PEP-CTERM system TPR-repeat lipoprotein